MVRQKTYQLIEFARTTLRGELESLARSILHNIPDLPEREIKGTLKIPNLICSVIKEYFNKRDYLEKEYGLLPLKSTDNRVYDSILKIHQLNRAIPQN